MENEQQKTRMFVSLRVKLLVGFTVVFSLLSLIAFFVIFNIETERAKADLDANLQTALATLGESIDGDEFAALVNDPDVELVLADDRGTEDPGDDIYFADDPRFWTISRAQWSVFKATGENALPWTFFKTPDAYVRVDESGDVVEFLGLVGEDDDADFVNDPDVETQQSFLYVVPGLSLASRLEGEELPDWMVNFRQRDYAITGNLFSGLDGIVTFIDDDDVYEWQTDEQGNPLTWVSGYGPITNSDGEIVGGLGMDYRYAFVEQVQEQVRNASILAFGLSYVVLSVLVFLIFGYFTRPVITLTRAAERIAEGDYNVQLSNLSIGRYPDEISTMASVFSFMIGKVEERETKLKEEVAELKIMIDERKLDQQVSEIVDTDFFSDLQSKAKTMRRRKRGEPVDFGDDTKPAADGPDNGTDHEKQSVPDEGASE